MTDKVKTTSIEHIEALIEKAATTPVQHEAALFAQAAKDTASALAVITELRTNHGIK